MRNFREGNYRPKTAIYPTVKSVFIRIGKLAKGTIPLLTFTPAHLMVKSYHKILSKLY